MDVKEAIEVLEELQGMTGALEHLLIKGHEEVKADVEEVISLLQELEKENEELKQNWMGFKEKYKNCWLVGDEVGVTTGNLFYLMDKFLQ